MLSIAERNWNDSGLAPVDLLLARAMATIAFLIVKSRVCRSDFRPRIAYDNNDDAHHHHSNQGNASLLFMDPPSLECPKRRGSLKLNQMKKAFPTYSRPARTPTPVAVRRVVRLSPIMK